MTTVAVVGLGYVGLPLAIEFGKKYRTIGFDLSQDKIDAYRKKRRPDGRGRSRGVQGCRQARSDDQPALAARSRFHHRRGAHAGRRGAQPRLRPAGRREHLGRPEPRARGHRGVRIDRVPRRDRGSLRPGAREALGPASGSSDFFVGYSPERINPGDKRAHADQDHEGRVRATRPRRSSASRRSTAASSRPACTAPARSRWPRPPR